jgi:hypothetical protein
MAAKKNPITRALKRQARESVLALEKAHKELHLHIQKHKRRLKAMNMFAA